MSVFVEFHNIWKKWNSKNYSQTTYTTQKWSNLLLHCSFIFIKCLPENFHCDKNMHLIMKAFIPITHWINLKNKCQQIVFKIHRDRFTKFQIFPADQPDITFKVTVQLATVVKLQDMDEWKFHRTGYVNYMRP